MVISRLMTFNKHMEKALPQMIKAIKLHDEIIRVKEVRVTTDVPKVIQILKQISADEEHTRRH